MEHDLQPCSFHHDFILVKYKNVDRTTKVESYTKFIKKYPDRNDRPPCTVEIQPVKENVQCIFAHYNIKIGYNEIRHKLEVFIGDDTLSVADSLVKIWDCCEKHGFRIKKDRLKMQIVKIGNENKFNVVKDYILECHRRYQGIELNNMSETNKLIGTLVLSDTNDTEKTKLYVTKFLTQSVALATCDEEDDVVTQFILVLKGKQGVGKTTWFKKLIPKHMQSKYFMAGRTLDPNNKDHIIEMNNVWLCELGEMGSTTGKANNEQLKALITNDYDTVRLPYAEEAVTLKRRASLCATTNDERFLKDATGSRRFVTVNIDKINKDANIDIDLVYAEIYNAYLNGAIFHFTDTEREELEITNVNYKIKNEIQESIETFFELQLEKGEEIKDCKPLTAKQIHRHISINSHYTDKIPSTVLIGRTLAQAGVVMKKLSGNRKAFMVKIIEEEVKEKIKSSYDNWQEVFDDNRGD